MKGFKASALVALAASFVVVSAQAQAPAPVAGRDYIEILNGRPLEPAADGVIVVEEFFNYICPACNSFEPTFVSWTSKLPSYVKVVHVPATFRADFIQYAKAYYAAEALGRKMLVVQRTRGRERACPIARQYLQREPSGPYAKVAAEICPAP